MKMDKMKAYTANDRYCDSETVLVVFAENSKKARAYAAKTEELREYGYIGIYVKRIPQLDAYYRGKPEMDWFDDGDRYAMIRYGGFHCSYEDHIDEEECHACIGFQWCEIWADRGGEMDED